MRFRLTAVVSTDAAFECLRPQLPVCLCPRPFARHPLRLHRLEPWALHGPPQSHAPAPVAWGLHPLLVPGPPGAYRLTLVPRGLISAQDQGRAPLRRPALTAPARHSRGTA